MKNDISLYKVPRDWNAAIVMFQMKLIQLKFRRDLIQTPFDENKVKE